MVALALVCLKRRGETAMQHDIFQTPSQVKYQKTTEKVTLWVKPAVKAELKRLAGMDELTVSKTGAALLEAAIHQKLHVQHALLLQPIIEQTVRKELRSFSNRLVFFLMRIAFASEQARILITNVLDRILRREGMTGKTFTSLVDQSNKLARRNIIHKTPQLQTLLDEWEASNTSAREEGSAQAQ
jgi:hypothetical protein